MSGHQQPRVPRPADPARATLDKAAAENFPVAPFFLPSAWRDDLMALYGFARLVDDIGDGDLDPGGADLRALGLAPGAAGDRLAALDAFETDLRRAFAAAGRSVPAGDPGAADPDGPPRHPLLRGLVPAVRRHALTPEPFLGLIAANRQDQRVRRYADYGELVAYCELSANPVGNLVLQVSGTLTPERLRRSDAVCTGLQIVEHLQDVREDLGRDRIYLPADDLRRFHVTEADLAAPSASASVRSLIAYQADRARKLLLEGVPLVGSVRGRLRLLLAGFVGGGLAAVDAIASAGFDVLPGPPKPARTQLLRSVGAVMQRARREG
ncbi:MULTISPECIES: squalene synthase HpnC [Streptomyces]|uniref:Squalene synthase HpnC n=1 Tax=Streptomyces tsukubensis (strain DSM 42081 / NBRC 108919 / NRRL 18488 / 9993) TaxID=1114943 RepID=I2N9L2_STRT9|nr:MULTISPECIES: squalene synthase HpnC [Streptomyces]AZK97550.1 squalene synthase HpnC [Streptomyces tsukubensis]EIF93709.1 squalene synthase HpnC [Streptomyces tsukubensis NRRL18488]MYS68040.1 squalene synthase HpnC [Streptomyces sp. SID5473]QKM66504.1 squalene synthase HpnC [Streptomyces tsukubensis NRRL18488]TAI45157.1 squalene synthase HpnC [Streptomyces tsukubensis]